MRADNAALRLLILEELMNASRSERRAELAQAGVKPETLDRLRRAPWEDAALVAARADLRIAVSIDGDSLELGLNRIERQHADDALKEYFARHGATPALMQHLFKLDRPTLERLRKATGSVWRGRPPMPKPDERDAIHARWQQISGEEPDPRLRYFKLHEAFPHWAIRVLEAVLKEFED